jgi:4-hydroxybenzoate polyprenyltransferase
MLIAPTEVSPIRRLLHYARLLLVQMRPYLLFVSGITGMAGVAVSPSPFAFKTLVFIILPLFLSYGFGQALTDCFQLDTDSLSAPDRPLCRGALSLKSVLYVSVVALLLLTASLIAMNPLNALLGCAAVLGLLTYTPVKKHYSFAGPPYNAWIITILPVMGYLSVTHGTFASLLNTQVALLCCLTFTSYTTFVVIGYLKDISADRATGYRTFPVRFGWTPTLYLGDALVALSTTIAIFLVGCDDASSLSILVGSSLVASVGQLSGHFARQKTERHAHLAIASSVRALIGWHLAVIVHLHHSWLFPLVVYYIGFELCLALRPQRHQI